MNFNLFEDKDQIFNAYKKLKHYYFYDNSTLFVREKLAQFEAEVFKTDTDIDALKKSLYDKVNEAITQIKLSNGPIVDQIGTHLLPKNIKKVKSDIVTNNSKETKTIEVERLNIYIDAPIEIHIISVLWVMYAGRFLNQEIGESCYANKLHLDINKETFLPQENLKLYTPYFVQYQQWRDDAINKAESLLKENRNVTILSLDIKDYFHSVRLNFDHIKKNINIQIKNHFFTKKADDVQIKLLDAAKEITEVLRRIHHIYFQKLKNVHPYKDQEITECEQSGNYPLPIGLISSGFLGNYYLLDFDKMIVENINPAFYGRYVDDLMFVFSDLDNHNQQDLISPTLSFINKNFVNKNVLEIVVNNSVAEEHLFSNGNYLDKRECIKLSEKIEQIAENFDINQEALIQQLVNTIKFKIKNRVHRFCGSIDDGTRATDYSNLFIQASKSVLHYFNFKESHAVLNIFKKRLEKQRSEFRFLPDEDEISEQFDEEAFSLKYNDSENKFRSIEDFSENKYGASKFLAKKIFAISFGGKELDEVTDKQIITFFKESAALNFYSLWEKVVTYFVIIDRSDHLTTFTRNVKSAIEKLTICEKSKNNSLICNKDVVLEDLKKELNHFLKVAISIALALKPKLEFKFLDKKEKDDLSESLKTSELLRVSNLFRSSLISLPGINYTNVLYTNESLLQNDFGRYFRPNHSDIMIITKDDNPKAIGDSTEQKDSEKEELVMHKLAWLAPNYVPFHELNILKIVSTISTMNISELEKEIPKDCRENANGLVIDKINGIPDGAFSDYYLLNFGWKTSYDEKDGKYDLKSKYFSVKETASNLDNLRHFEVSTYGEKDENLDNEKIDKRVALANIKVHDENVERSFLQRPNLSRERRKTIFRLLNEADRLESDLIVFPEVSIPYSWLRLLAERAHKRYMGVVAGLEHWVNMHNVAFNFMVTILPFKVNGNITSLIKIRLKNHYSPKEKEILTGYRLLVPKENIKNYKMSYDLFHWRNTYFSVYNCFELADIYHRSIFKSKVDFIVASELNPDTEYFSDIAGAWVRDVHSYFIQVNSSHYGDSRLIQPAKSFKKDLIQVKGGINSTILIDTIQIEKLRKFQLMEYHLQKLNIEKGKYDFKPTPPDFDHKNVIKRCNNESFNTENDG